MFFTRSRKTLNAGPRLRLETLEGRDLPSTTPLTLTVHPGQSIQTAVNDATPGSTIYIEPGTYSLAQTVTIDKAGLKLVGRPGRHGAPVVLLNQGGVQDGISVTANGGGFELRNVVVQGFADNGVLLTGVDQFTISHVAAVNDANYGIFPAFCSHGVIEFSSASGSGDTGIYVGQSGDVTVRANTVHDNLNGIEIENSTNVRVTGNIAYRNTVGLLVDLLPATVPGIEVVASSQVTVADNFILFNNRANSAAPPDITATEQSGVGILLIGGDRTTVRNNWVLGNDTGGVILLSGLDLLTLAGLPADSYGSVDPNPAHTTIRDNVVLDNGRNPADRALPHADLIASASALAGTDNHWIHNLFRTSVPSPLP
jgi:parallel beta-helix repeat protein